MSAAKTAGTVVSRMADPYSFLFKRERMKAAYSNIGLSFLILLPPVGQSLEIILSLGDIKRHNLEVYYNGDRSLSDFKIKCYRRSGQNKVYVGMYTPDFLVIQRKDGKIRKIVIVETKGKIYSNDPAFKDRRLFVENEFVAFNNKAFGYKRFDFLYLEDSLSERDRTRLIHDKINCFFGGEK